MEKDIQKTKVIFLYNEQEKDLFAYFPIGWDDGEYHKKCYSHVGQHSTCHPKYAFDSRKATVKEYTSLKKELESIGYNLETVRVTEQEGKTFPRYCSVTGKGMTEGYCFGEGEEYAFDKKSALILAKKYGYKTLAQSYKDENHYYTEWEEPVDEYEYIVKHGVAFEIEQVEDKPVKEEPSVWDFVVQWYPKYTSSAEIAHNDDLCKLDDGEFDEGDHAHKLLMDTYGGDINNPQIKIDLAFHTEQIYREAIIAYMNRKQ